MKCVMFGVAQEKEKTVNKAPIQNVTPASAEETFKSYCAACHGKDAEGAGPATVDLKSTPPDLTTLAKRHGGKFPADYVSNVLRNGVKAPAHGSSDIPFGDPFLLLWTATTRRWSICGSRILSITSSLCRLNS